MRNKKTEKLVLGTAQLGFTYGIANKTGQPQREKAVEIVKAAWWGGITRFDTAQGYGTSENNLGYAFRALGISDQAKVISKLNPDIDTGNQDDIKKSIQQSMDNLGVDHLYGLLIHRESILDQWENGLGKNLSSICTALQVKHLGISVYSPEHAIRALLNNDIGIIQIPTNILDQRFEKAGIFQLALAKKKKIFVRSVFLQGLLTMAPHEIPPELASAKTLLQAARKLAEKSAVSVPKMALGYVRKCFPEAHVIFGAESIEQVTDNLSWWNWDMPDTLVDKIKNHFSSVDENILNPSRWQIQGGNN